MSVPTAGVATVDTPGVDTFDCLGACSCPNAIGGTAPKTTVAQTKCNNGLWVILNTSQ
jgi:hypothetical protein